MVCVPFLGSIANFEALMTMTLSPTIAFGVNSGLSLPRRMLAMTTASRPTLWSVASIKIQRRVTVSGLKNVVFIHILLVNSLVDYHKPAISQRLELSLIHISEPTRLGMISYAV